MSDIEEFAEELNNQDPVDFESLAEAFDTVFYEEPEGSNPLEAKHVSGLTINSPQSVDEVVEKLNAAKEVEPRFIQIDGREYTFDSENSLSRLIDGIRIGSQGCV